MSIDMDKKIYLIVHGQRQLADQVKEKLAAKGFKQDKMQMASLDRAGEPGEYVAMIWPPMSPKEIVVSQITAPGEGESKSAGMGAWANVGQKELYRTAL